MTTDEEKAALLAWVATARTGASSLTLMTETAGLPHTAKGISYPSDGGDLGRCLGLIRAVPGARKAVDSLAEKNPHWAALAAEWDRLTYLFATDPDKVYPAMKACLAASENADPNIVSLGNGISVRFGR